MVLDVVWVSYVDYLVLGVSIKGIESLPSCFISVSILKLGPRNKCRVLYIQSTPPTTSLLLTQSYTPRLETSLETSSEKNMWKSMWAIMTFFKVQKVFGLPMYALQAALGQVNTSST